MFMLTLNKHETVALITELEATALGNELAIARAALTVIDEGLTATYEFAADSTTGQFIEHIGAVLNDTLADAWQRACDAEDERFAAL